jgi:hypothetical protein
MLFAYPGFPAQFEIPDSWWREAGMINFTPSGPFYRTATPECYIVSLVEIKPILQSERPPLDFCGFREEALVRILAWIADGSEIPAVVLRKLSQSSAFAFELHGGFHRFHAAVAAGFEFIPAKFYEELSAEECFALS